MNESPIRATPSQALPVAAGEAVRQPFAYCYAFRGGINRRLSFIRWTGVERTSHVETPLYAGSPPTAREPLTEERIHDLLPHAAMTPQPLADLLSFARAIESAHGIVAAPTGGDGQKP